MFFPAFLLLAALSRPGEAVAAEWREADWNSRSALEARRAATISAETDGKVTRVHREMGEAFRKGDVLVELDGRLARAAADAAKASLGAATAVLSAATSMYASNSASQIELEEARRDVAETTARFERATHESDACTIVAPFDGRVVEVFVNEHELVDKGRPVVSIIDDRMLTAKFLFPEDRFGHVSIGDLLDINIPVAGVSRQARVSHIAPIIDPASRTLDVWASVDNADADLRPGMTVVLADDERAEPNQ